MKSLSFPRCSCMLRCKKISICQNCPCLLPRETVARGKVCVWVLFRICSFIKVIGIWIHFGNLMPKWLMGQLKLWSQSQKLHSRLLNVVSGKIYAMKWHYGFAIHYMQIRRGWQPCNWHSIAAIILTRCRRQGYPSSTQHRGGKGKDNPPAVQLLASFPLRVI